MDFLDNIKGGPEILTLVVAVASVVSAFVPDSKWPGGANGILARIVNYLAFNVGKAKNDPSVN